MRKPDPFEAIIWVGLAILLGSVVWAIVWFGWFYKYAAFK